MSKAKGSRIERKCRRLLKAEQQRAFRHATKAEVDAAEARRVALCKRWTGRAS